MKPKIACICCTYLRPHLLAESLHYFLWQDYPADRRELIIVDDTGQYDPKACDGIPGVKFVSFPSRARTLGEKRNITAALASPDVDAYAVWDDDDVYLPWHLSAIGATIEQGAQWVRPSKVWIDRRTRLESKAAKGLFHGAWGFTRDAFRRADGYPFEQSGQDQLFARRLETRLKLKSVCPMEAGVESRPSYIYRWFSTAAAWHISGGTSYEQLGDKAQAELAGAKPINQLTPTSTRDWLRLAGK